MHSRKIESESGIQQRIADISVRPIRFGYIINRTIEYETLRKTFYFNTCHWGGYFNIFVPTDGEHIRTDWLRLLAIHDPDVLICVGEIALAVREDLYNLLQPMLILDWDDELAANTEQGSKVNAILMDIILERLLAEQGRLTPDQSKIRCPDFNGEFGPYLETMYGLWSPESKYRDFAEKNLGAIGKPVNPGGMDDYLESIDQFDQNLCPLHLTKHGLTLTYSNSVGSNSLVITSGELDDIFIQFALGWSDSFFTGRRNRVIIPLSALKTDNDIKALAEWYGMHITHTRLNLISLSLGMDVMIDIRNRLKVYLSRHSKQTQNHEWTIKIKRCNVLAPVPTVSNLESKQIYNALSNSYSFELPRPTFITNDTRNRYQYKRWICDIDLSPRFGNRQGFAPSKFADLNFLLSNYPERRYLAISGSPTRIARQKLSLAANVKDNLKTFTLPEDQLIIETACANAGFEVREGNSVYYQGMINLIGELEDARFLHNPYVLDLFSSAKVIRGGALTIIDMCQQLKIGKANRDEFEDWIQILASKEVLLRGYKLKCPVCHLHTWYMLANVRERMRCEGCRTEFQPPVDVSFSYKLNLLFEDRNNQGTIAVLMLLLLLQNTTLNDLIWQAEVKLSNHEEELELDIIAMCDGYLLVAECKNSILPRSKQSVDAETINRKQAKVIQDLLKQLEREIKVANELGANLFLFASLEEPPDEVSQFIEEQNSVNTSMCVRLVTSSELKNGKFEIPEKQNKLITIYDIVGDYALPSLYVDAECSDQDED